MPGFDKTGPGGQGPMTGRGQGPCNENSNNNQMPPQSCGRGFGRNCGRGFGRGFRNFFRRNNQN